MTILGLQVPAIPDQVHWPCVGVIRGEIWCGQSLNVHVLCFFSDLKTNNVFEPACQSVVIIVIIVWNVKNGRCRFDESPPYIKCNQGKNCRLWPRNGNKVCRSNMKFGTQESFVSNFFLLDEGVWVWESPTNFEICNLYLCCRFCCDPRKCLRFLFRQ